MQNNYFLSHSTKDKELVEMFINQCFIHILEERENRYFYSGNSETGIDGGVKWRQQLVSEARDCTKVIAFVTKNYLESIPSQWEIGLALAYEKDIVPIILLGEEKIPGLEDINHINISDKEALTTFLQKNIDEGRKYPVNKISRGFKDIDKLIKSKQNKLRSGSKRIVDVKYLIQSVNHCGNPRQEIKEKLGNEVLSEYLLYCTPLGAHRWLQLCDDVEYESQVESLQFIMSMREDIFNVMSKECLGRNPDFISLGPGNGAKDNILLRQFVKHKTLNDNPILYYYPYDISSHMLLRTNDKIINDESLGRIQITAVQGNFDEIGVAIEEIIDMRPGPNIIGFLGNTLGNKSDELTFLTSLHSAIHVGDYLLLEVRLVEGLRENSPGGSDDIRKRFNFSPLEEIGVEYEPDKLKYVDRGKLSQLDDAVTIRGIYRDFEFDGANRIDEATLCHINYYNLDTLSKKVAGLGFKVCLQKESENKIVGLLVLEKV